MTHAWSHIVSWNEDRVEKIADAVVHVIGLALALAGTGALLVYAFGVADAALYAAVVIYLAGLIASLAASSLYNIWPNSQVKWLLRRLDHSAIFLLIAGTYTPFIAQMPANATSTALFIGVWAVAAIGIVLKLAFPGRFDRLAVGAYLALGWCGVLVFPAIQDAIPSTTLWLIAAGGITYSAGVVFYAWEGLRFNKAIWHGFVLAGTALHYGAVIDSLSVLTV
ncbi:hemolysin III family protein [Breoghania sp. L-A4]|uniref:PAQR family membrane homeostasis protein TrhA n=1 Tax=Breoghania sp. L-A4 TaxID=2304600 RepID=UPI000E35B7CF|nr:hemolysin III family protein [Breoghania sp. L-A4]AXS42787.1 hemolysin III family protein [Breoghania sp. L-A4]